MSAKKPKEEQAVRRAWLFPKTLSSALTVSTRESLRERGFGQRNIVRDWAQIVGPELAADTFPLELKPKRGNMESRLVVRAPAPWP